jgi:hypothetical protein
MACSVGRQYGASRPGIACPIKECCFGSADLSHEPMKPFHSLIQLIQSFTSAELRGTRLIDETDAALAMRFVDYAGIDITGKAI